MSANKTDPLIEWLDAPLPVPTAADLAALAAEAETLDPPGTSMRWANATPEERQRILAYAADERAERKASHDRLRDAMLPADWAEYLRTAPPEVQEMYGYQPADDPQASMIEPAATSGPAVLVRLNDVKPEHVEWLWPARIPLGKLTVLDGDPGLGKSTISIDLAARVSTGRPMPGETTARHAAGVVLMSAEDGLADTIRPRLDAAGADVSRVVALVGIAAGDGTERLPTLPGDLAPLEAAIAEHGAVLVVVDVLMAYLSGDINAHRDQDVRGALAQLAAVAERTGAAIVVLRHLNKSAGGPAIYRGGGSIGIIGAARSALVVGRDPDDEERFILAVSKANLAPLAPSLAYRIVERNGTGAVEWEGVTAHTATQLLAVAVTADERTALDDARHFLEGLLADGPVSANEVRGEARAAGIAPRTLDRAKAALGVRSIRPGGFTGPWAWSLPDAVLRQLPPYSVIPRSDEVRPNVAMYTPAHGTPGGRERPTVPDVSDVPSAEAATSADVAPEVTVLDFEAPLCETCGRRKRAVVGPDGRFVCTFPHRPVRSP